MQIKEINSIIIYILIILVIVICIGDIFFDFQYTSDKLQPISRYKIIRPLYLAAEYNSLNNRQIRRDAARAYLEPKQYYKKSWVAFQCEVPVGTTMVIIGPSPKVWPVPFFANRYFVQLNPDLSRGLDIILELNRGIEGELDGLNPEIFIRLE